MAMRQMEPNQGYATAYANPAVREMENVIQMSAYQDSRKTLERTLEGDPPVRENEAGILSMLGIKRVGHTYHMSRKKNEVMPLDGVEATRGYSTFLSNGAVDNMLRKYGLFTEKITGSVDDQVEALELARSLDSKNLANTAQEKIVDYARSQLEVGTKDSVYEAKRVMEEAGLENHGVYSSLVKDAVRKHDTYDARQEAIDGLLQLNVSNETLDMIRGAKTNDNRTRNLLALNRSIEYQQLMRSNNPRHLEKALQIALTESNYPAHMIKATAEKLQNMFDVYAENQVHMAIRTPTHQLAGFHQAKDTKMTLDARHAAVGIEYDKVQNLAWGLDLAIKHRHNEEGNRTYRDFEDEVLERAGAYNLSTIQIDDMIAEHVERKLVAKWQDRRKALEARTEALQVKWQNRRETIDRTKQWLKNAWSVISGKGYIPVLQPVRINN